MVAPAPGASVPIWQEICPEVTVQLPVSIITPDTCVLSETESVRTTFVACPGPLFETFTLTVTLSPIRPLFLDALAETARSAGRTALTITEAELFFELRSDCVAATSRSSENVPTVVGLTVNCTVADDGSVIAPRLHVTVVVPLQVPWLGWAEMNFNPAGKWSVKVTPEAFCGPSLITVA